MQKIPGYRKTIYNYGRSEKALSLPHCSKLLYNGSHWKVKQVTCMKQTPGGKKQSLTW